MNDGPRKNRKALIAAAALGVVLTVLLFWGEYDVFTLWGLHRERAGLAREVEQLKVENQQLIDQIEGLKDNPEVIEKIARENIGMAGRGETVYRILPESADSIRDSLRIRE